MAQDTNNQPEQNVETVDLTAIPTVFADTFEKFGVPVKGLVAGQTFRRVE